MSISKLLLAVLAVWVVCLPGCSANSKSSSNGGSGPTAEDGSNPAIDGASGTSAIDGGGGGGGGTSSIDGGGGPPPPPVNPGTRLLYNFNVGWKFSKVPSNATGPSAPSFDDSAWTDVSLPHTYDDVDNFGLNWVGVHSTYNGYSWYRKHFTIDASNTGRKVFVELQSIRDAGTVYVNGTKIGLHEDEVSSAGFDITSAVQFGQDNVIAVLVNANDLSPDESVVPGWVYDWSTIVFYPKYGGLVGDSTLTITDTIHQTLPLWNNLRTQGVYVYADPSTIDTAGQTATITVQSEVQNETNAAQDVTLSMEVFDYNGNSVGTATAASVTVPPSSPPPFDEEVAPDAGTDLPSMMDAGITGLPLLTTQVALTGVHFWAPNYPYLYTVRSTISIDGKAGDSVDIPFGVRKFSWNLANGFKINGHSTYLAGFAPRMIMDWAGAGIPQDWMTEYDFVQMKAINHFFIRPMHVAPMSHIVDSADRLGVLMAVPAGDGEYCPIPGLPPPGVTWPQHVALMRAVTIYYRNHASVPFYEGCNGNLTEPQMLNMVDIRKTWDAHGGRYAGSRATDTQNEPSQEYQSPMDNPAQSTTIPCWSAEYARQESPRNVWDAYSPFYDPKTNAIIPSGGMSAAYGGLSTYPGCDFLQNSLEDLSLCYAWRYWQQYALSNFVLPMSQRSTQGIMIGGAKIIYQDSSTDGRFSGVEVARVGGVIDGVRIIKDDYYVMRVMASPTPDIHILGHWNYAAGTVKKVYVAANTQAVTLAVYDPNGNLLKNYGNGVVDTQQGANQPSQYIFDFPNVTFQAGSIKAIGLNGGTQVVTDTRVTTGSPAALKLTPIYGPQGWLADGADIAMVDVEVVDSNGLRVPIETSPITFTHSGAGTWIGGYNTYMAQSAYPNQGIFTDNLRTDAGINRVLVRSSLTAGTFTITVSRQGLADATVTLTSQPFPVTSGLATAWPQRYNLPLPATEPTAVPDN